MAPPILAGSCGLRSHRVRVRVRVFKYTNQWPRSYTALLKKGFSLGEKNYFLPWCLSNAVLIPVSQGTEVTLVTKYVFSCFLKILWDLLGRSFHQQGTGKENIIVESDFVPLCDGTTSRHSFINRRLLEEM